MDIPVFHDDQHGTAIISGAALLNALELTGKDIAGVRMAVSGAGAAAIACCEFFVSLGMRRENIVLADTKGVVYRGRAEGMNAYKARFATDRPARTLAEAMDGADVFLGVSVAGVVTEEMVLSMADAPIVFALANPDPEISYPAARAARRDVLMATGRSDYPNQVNNVLGFPFIFRGALDVRARAIDNGMMVAAARALADLAKEDVPDSVLRAYGVDRLEFGPEYLIPKPLDPRVPLRVAPAVAAAAMASGVARNTIDLAAYTEQLANRLTRGREVMSDVTRKAQTAPKRVVFSEGEERKIILAAARIQQEHIGLPILLGREDVIRATMKELRVTVPIEIVDPATTKRAGQLRRRTARKAAAEGNHPARGSCAAPPAELLRRHDGAGGRRRRLRRRPDLPLSRRHRARPASDRVRARGLASGRAVRDDHHDGRAVVLTDPTVNFDPTAEELADIAIMAAERARELRPRATGCAAVLLQLRLHQPSSFGEDGRSHQLVKTRRPDLMVDGEMMADVALSPVAARRGLLVLRPRGRG